MLRRVASICVVVIALLVSGCAPSSPWRRPTGYHPVAPLVFSDQDLVGQGVVRTPQGYVTRRCLETSPTAVRGGEPSMALLAADDARLRSEVAWQRLLERQRAQLPRAREASRAVEAIAVAVQVTVSGLQVELDEASVRLRPEALSLVARGDEVGFFALCGTELVVSARRDASARLLLTWLPETAEQAKALRARLASLSGGAAGDLLSLGALDDIATGVPTLVVGAWDAADAELPPEPGLASVDGAGVRRWLGRAVAVLLRSGRGRTVSFETRRWRTFGPARHLVPELSRDPRPQAQKELVAGRLELLEREVQRYWLRLWQSTWLVRRSEAPEAARCAATLVPMRRALGPQQLERCRRQARSSLVAAVELLPDCVPVTSALDAVLAAESCRLLGPQLERVEAPLLQDDTHQPLELVLGALPPTLVRDDLSGPLLADAWERSGPPPRIALGTGVDRRGRPAAVSCFAPPEADEEAEEKPPTAGDGTAVERYVWSQRQWDTLGDATDASIDTATVTDRAVDTATSTALTLPSEVVAPPDPEATSTDTSMDEDVESSPAGESEEVPSSETASDPAPSAATSAATSTAPSRFLFRMHAEHVPWERRGPPWWWWLTPWTPRPTDRVIHRGVVELAGLSEAFAADRRLTREAAAWARDDLELFFARCGTHYVAQVEHRRGWVSYFAPASPGGREVSVLPYGLSDEARRSPVVGASRVEGLLRREGPAESALADDEKAWPVRLRLEPWINYLRSQGYDAQK